MNQMKTMKAFAFLQFKRPELYILLYKLAIQLYAIGGMQWAAAKLPVRGQAGVAMVVPPKLHATTVCLPPPPRNTRSYAGLVPPPTL